MLFSKVTLLSLVAVATAIPAAMPEPEANGLEARTWFWKWNKNNCECDCKEENHYPRDITPIESRTLWYLGGSEKYCAKVCKKKCDDYYDEKLKHCKKEAWDHYDHCKNSCKWKREPEAAPEPNNDWDCKKQCKETYEHAIWECKKKYDH